MSPGAAKILRVGGWRVDARGMVTTRDAEPLGDLLERGQFCPPSPDGHGVTGLAAVTCTQPGPRGQQPRRLVTLPA